MPKLMIVTRSHLTWLWLSLSLVGCDGSDQASIQPTRFDYGLAEEWPQCGPDEKRDSAPPGDIYVTTHGIRYNVRAPSNYEPRFQHPLVVVYAAGSQRRKQSERFIGLTRAATASGFVVVYPDNPPMSIDSIVDLGQIPQQVSEKWCIDPSRIFFTGHSNGGLIATALAFLEATRQIPAAIAPSAAGISAEDFAEQECPAPLPVMVVHSANDKLFPGNGRAAAAWWGACNRCEHGPGEPDAAGCASYTQCANDVVTMYCEVSGRHSRWTGLNREILQFFLRAGPRR